MEDKEKSYRDIMDYIVACLEKEKAEHILGEIRELKNANVIEVEKSNVKKDVYREERKKVTISDSDISKSVSRKMTNKEVLIATIEILKSYLVSIPSLEYKIVKLLGNEYVDNVKWVYEDGEEVEDDLHKFKFYEADEICEMSRIIEEILKEVELIGNES